MATLTGCNEFYVTVSAKDKTFSYTLADIELSFDHTENRLKLELRFTEPAAEEKSLLQQLGLSLPERFELNRKCSVDSATA